MEENERLSAINVLVVATSPDLKAEGIAAAVEARADMDLVGHRVLTEAETNSLLQSLPSSPPCALVLVGPPDRTNAMAERWLVARADLVVMHVEIIANFVRISGVALRDLSLPSLLSALRGLVERVRTQPQQRVSRIRLRSVSPATDVSAVAPDRASPPRPLLNAAIDWMHQVLRDAVDQNGDVHGLSITRATLLQALDGPFDHEAGGIRLIATVEDPEATRAILTVAARASGAAGAERDRGPPGPTVVLGA